MSQNIKITTTPEGGKRYSTELTPPFTTEQLEEKIAELNKYRENETNETPNAPTLD
jgi:hypothetical protein